MAKTIFIKTEIEPHVRKWLAGVFPDHRFAEKPIRLKYGRIHRFDAVSEDMTIVGNILSNRAKTRTGRENTGAVRKAINDVLFLGLLPEGMQPVLVFTNTQFCDLIRKRSSGLHSGVMRMLVCPLPQGLQDQLSDVLDAASQEQRAVDEI